MATRRVAVFIDAENVAASFSSAIFEEATRHGVLTARRVYGDFSRPGLSSWLEALPRHALDPVQTAGGAVGRNGADIALVIDAMEMLCADEADVFCLASSDGDFTQLAMRVRQRGKTAIGIGRASASSRFRAACDRFAVIEPQEKIAKPTAAVASSKRRMLEQSLLREAMTSMAPSGDGWVNLSELSKCLRTVDPSFKVKSYGHSQLHGLLAFSGLQLTADHKRVRLNTPPLKTVVDNR